MNRSELEIMIVEDDPVINTDLSPLLRSERFKIVGVTSKGIKAFDILSNRKPNFAILDIHLGAGITGIDIAEVIHTKYQIPYIFLTSFSDEETMMLAQEQGPYGFLVKPFQDRTLISTITTAWHNHKRMLKASEIDVSAKLDILTPQEHSICKELIQGHSYKQICEKLFISMNTLKYHVKNIYLKMEVAGRAELSTMLLS